MRPPYTSLWLQSLLESKGTAAWLRTGEASPVTGVGRGGGHVVRGGPTGNSEGLYLGQGQPLTHTSLSRTTQVTEGKRRLRKVTHTASGGHPVRVRRKTSFQGH